MFTLLLSAFTLGALVSMASTGANKDALTVMAVVLGRFAFVRRITGSFSRSTRCPW